MADCELVSATMADMPATSRESEREKKRARAR